MPNRSIQYTGVIIKKSYRDKLKMLAKQYKTSMSHLIETLMDAMLDD